MTQTIEHKLSMRMSVFAVGTSCALFWLVVATIISDWF
jgi:hypothetical protein